MRRAWGLLLAALAGGAGPAQGQDPDTAAWEAARASGTPEACQQYLGAFPTGRYAEQAFRCVIEGLPSAVPASPRVGGVPSPDLY